MRRPDGRREVRETVTWVSNRRSWWESNSGIGGAEDRKVPWTGLGVGTQTLFGGKGHRCGNP